MGGRAFGFDAKRMDKWEYEDILSLSLSRIDSSQHYKGMGKGVISVTDKESFGDIDVLVPREHFSFEKFWDKHKFRYKGFKRNGGVISLLDNQDRQIDIITTPIAIYDVHFQYLAYNDMGNFMGRLAKSLNLKYGQDGLSLIVRHKSDPTRKIGVINISTDVSYIYSLLDIPNKVYRSMGDVYEAILNSKYYHKDSFLLEHQSHHARVRDKKRKSYNGLLQYIEDNDKSNTSRRKYSIEETLYMLPRFVTEQYIEMIALANKREYEKTLFNGNIVKNITGLSGKDLGCFMSHIKDKVDIYGDVDSQVKSFYSDCINN